MKSIFVSVAMFVAAAVALAQTPVPGSPAAVFRDDDMLIQAQGDISRMQRHELDFLADALAIRQVIGLSRDDAVRRQCDIASERYSVAYNSGRAINRVFLAVDLATRVMRLSGNPPANSPEQEKMFKDIERKVHIYGLLQRAFSARNLELSR